MYASIILEHTPPDAVVFVKPHPGETLPRHEAIASALEGRRECVPLDPRCKFLPVEIMPELTEHCSPCICMSYPRLSLAWLYGIDVINPMRTREFIEQWFLPHSWDHQESGIAQYEEPLNALKSWSGKGLLWTGKAPSRRDKHHA